MSRETFKAHEHSEAEQVSDQTQNSVLLRNIALTETTCAPIRSNCSPALSANSRTVCGGLLSTCECAGK